MRYTFFISLAKCLSKVGECESVCTDMNCTFNFQNGTTISFSLIEMGVIKYKPIFYDMLVNTKIQEKEDGENNIITSDAVLLNEKVKIMMVSSPNGCHNFLYPHMEYDVHRFTSNMEQLYRWHCALGSPLEINFTFVNKHTKETVMFDLAEMHLLKTETIQKIIKNCLTSQVLELQKPSVNSILLRIQEKISVFDLMYKYSVGE